MAATNNSSGAVTITSNGSITGTYGVSVTNSGTDVMVNVADTNAFGTNQGAIYVRNNGTGSTVITSTGTATSQSGSAIDVYNNQNTTGLTINAADTSGNAWGIYAINYGSGDVNITSTGTATGTTYDGINVNDYGDGDLNITANNVTGGVYGILVSKTGGGSTTITVSGTAIGEIYTGINVTTGSAGTDLTVNAANAQGYRGIYADNKGTGATTVTVTGTATGTTADGISANNSGSNTTNLTVTAVDTQGSNGAGISATNKGTGWTEITSTGTASGITGNGIRATIGDTASDLRITALNTQGYRAIYVENSGIGSTTITSSGTATGTSSDGIRVINDGNTTDLTINQTGGTISGADNGIFTTNSGVGPTVITVAGDVNGTGDNGIWAENYTAATDIAITQTAGTITGYTHGIRADNWGTGSTTVSTAGTITQSGSTSTDTFGVYAYNAATATDITIIQAAGSISANYLGIYGHNDGAGSTAITSSGDVTARSGIWAYNSTTAASDIVIEQTSAGTITSDSAGIVADNHGAGSTTVTTAGDITATAGTGINAANSSTATDLTVNQTGGTVTGAFYGIYAYNAGTGATAVTVASDVTGTNSFGIAAYGGANTTGVMVQQTAGSITGATGILLSNQGTGASLVSVVDKISGGAGAGIQTLAANGATIDIAASATLTASSGIAIRDGGVAGTPTASDTVGGNVVVNSAGTVTGDAVLGLGDDTFNLTGGTYTGNIYGDDRDDAQSNDGIVNHEGNDTFNWTGGKLVGGFYGQDGSDTAIVTASAYDGSQVLDGGDDTSIADGMIDTLTLKGVTATTNGGKIANWEVVNLDGANLSIDDGAWHVGEPDEATTGVNLTNGSTLDGMASLDFDGNMTIDSSSTFVGTGDGTGVYSFSGNVTNAGTITTVDDAVGDVVIIGGNYAGNGGQMLFDVVLGDDNSKTDMVIVNGDTSGTTNIGINNVGGTGAQTSEGIRIIEVDGASNGTFSLIGDYTIGGKQAVVAGAYAYQLYQGGTSTPNDGNWYLRSQLPTVSNPSTTPSIPTDPTTTPTTPATPTTPLYQAGVPTYEAYPQALLGLNGVPTLQQRVGNRFWAGNGNKVVTQGADPVGTPYAAPEEAGVAIEGNGVWGRIEGAHNSIEPRVSTSGTDYDQNVFKLQAGIDGLLAETENGKLIGGFTVHYAHGKTKTSSVYGDGEISTDGYGLGGTLTWYGENGFYLDGQGQVTWYRSDLDSVLAHTNLTDDNDGFGYTLSLEGGKRIAINPAWSVTPQAQLVYSNVDFDAFTDVFGARVSLDRGESLQGRLGLTLDHENSWQNDKGLLDRTHVYGIANLYYEFLEGTKVDVQGVSFASRNDRLWGGLGVGGTYNWDDDKYSVYGEGLVNTSLNNFGDSYSIKGQVGFRMKW